MYIQKLFFSFSFIHKVRARVKRIPYALRSRTRGPIVIIPPAGAEISGGAPSSEMMPNCILHLGIEKAIKQRHEESLKQEETSFIISIDSLLEERNRPPSI